MIYLIHVLIIEYWIHRVLDTQSIGYTEYWIHRVLNTQSIGYTEYWIHRVLDTQSIGYTEYWIHRALDTQSIGYTVLNTQSIEYTEYWIHRVLDTQSIEYTEHWIHTLSIDWMYYPFFHRDRPEFRWSPFPPRSSLAARPGSAAAAPRSNPGVGVTKLNTIVKNNYKIAFESWRKLTK
jgi:hypothetical protein